MADQFGSAGTAGKSGTLYVVATPIGHLQDISLRALEVLKDVDWIACEDTRHSARLLKHFNIHTPCLSYHEHNEEQRSQQLLDRLQQGQSGALISDAGTPMVSDPGFVLVRQCRREGLIVTAVPGPSAAIAALSVSGLPSAGFLFAGFPPRKTGEARRFFERWSTFPATAIFFLPPHRLQRHLEVCLEVLGPRQAFLVRELTKIHEESWWGDLADLVTRIAHHSPKGEYTLVVQGAAREVPPPALELDVAAYVAGLKQLRGKTRREALKMAAQQLGIPRNQLYRELLDQED